METKINQTDYVVTLLLSSNIADWGHLREIEHTQESLKLDPDHLMESLEEIERAFSCESILRTMSTIGEEVLDQYIVGNEETIAMVDRLRGRLSLLPYYAYGPKASQVDELEVLIMYVFPWALYLMLTDPAL